MTPHRSCGSDCTGNDCVAAATADIDALLAEVERLKSEAEDAALEGLERGER